MCGLLALMTALPADRCMSACCRANVSASMHQGAEAGWPAARKPVQQQPGVSGPPAVRTLRRACEPIVLLLSSFVCHRLPRPPCLHTTLCPLLPDGSSDRQQNVVMYCTGPASEGDSCSCVQLQDIVGHGNLYSVKAVNQEASLACMT